MPGESSRHFQVFIPVSFTHGGQRSKYPRYRLHTGCQWAELPVSKDVQTREERHEPSWQAVYHHWRKWRGHGSLERVWQASLGSELIQTFGAPGGEGIENSKQCR
jgi:transposase